MLFAQKSILAFWGTMLDLPVLHAINNGKPHPAQHTVAPNKVSRPRRWAGRSRPGAAKTAQLQSAINKSAQVNQSRSLQAGANASQQVQQF